MCSSYFQEGLDEIIGYIDVAVRQVVGPLNLKKEMTVRDILGLIMVIRDKVGSWTSFMCLLRYGKGS